MTNVQLPTDAFQHSSALTADFAGTNTTSSSSFVDHSTTTTTTTSTTTTFNTAISSSSTSSSSFSTTTAVSTCPTSTDSFDSNEERPCEKYRQFMDSSRQERTFMIEKLVETFANVIDSIWHPRFITEQHKVKVMPTRGFINEILKRSKATYSTVQISLFYVFRVKKVVHEKLMRRYNPKSSTSQQQQQLSPSNQHMEDLMCCGRRMFLASLMVASKYLHDKNYQNKAWCKISGLDIKEVNAAEMAFLNLIDYRLHVSKPTFDKWYTQLHGHIQKSLKTNNHGQKTGNPLLTPPPPPSPSSSTHSITTAEMTPINIKLSSSTTSSSLSEENNVHTMCGGASKVNYPSPPPDLNDNNNSKANIIDIGSKYQRTDSGIELGVLSPPQQENDHCPVPGVKRQFDDSDMSIITSTNKRQCQ